MATIKFRKLVDDVSPAMQRFASMLQPGEMAAILRAGAARFKFITVQNFGNAGKDRPVPWAPLSSEYAKRVKRGHATMELTGEMLRSIRVSEPSGNSVAVYSDDPKAEYHHYGTSKLPARPVFPVDQSGELTPLARREIETAMELEMQQFMRDVVK